VKQYGRNFHLRIHAAAPPESEWPTDLRVPFTDIVDLCSQYFGLGLFRQALQGGKITLTEQDRKNFERELTTEKSTLHQTEDGLLERIVAVVALKLTNQQGQIFVQMARFKEADRANELPDVKVLCELPGSKRAIGELPQRALQRILEEDLMPFQDFILPIGSEDDTFSRESPRYGMRTTYMRTVHGAMLTTRSNPEPLERCRFALPSDVPLPYVREVYAIKALHTDERRFFTWLSQEDFDDAKKPESQEMLQKWLPTQLLDMFHVSLVEGSGELREDSLVNRDFREPSFHHTRQTTPPIPEEEEDVMDLDEDTTCDTDLAVLPQVESLEKLPVSLQGSDTSLV